MNKNFKYFLIAFLIGLPLWWGTNALGENLKVFFYWFEMGSNQKLLAAQASQVAFQNQIIDTRPVRIESMPEIEISAESAISILVDNLGREKMLFEKEIDKKLPIASITKLITAKVVIDKYDLSKKITISKEAVNQEENFGKLEAGQTLSVKYLLYPLLIESSNDAAFALANDYEGLTEKDFIKLMNEESIKINMMNTQFFNPTGLEPDIVNPAINYSTARDLSKLAKSLLGESLIWEILSLPKFSAYGPELINTNELLSKFPVILGGKTGYAEKAGGCLLLVVKTPNNNGYIVNVILGSDNRFGEMEKLVNWVNSAYGW